MSTAHNHHDDRDQNHVDDEILSIDEAAAFLRTFVSTMRYWRHLGTGPRSFKVGRHVRYWRSDLILWLAEQARRPQNHQ